MKKVFLPFIAALSIFAVASCQKETLLEPQEQVQSVVDDEGIAREWEELQSTEMADWTQYQYFELGVWYMLSLNEEQEEEGYSDFLNEFVALHRDLLDRTLEAGRNETSVKESQKLWEALSKPSDMTKGQHQTEARFWDWMGYGHKRWSLGPLPANRKISHVTIPGANDALAYKPVVPKELGSIAGTVLFRLLRHQDTDLATMFDRGVRAFDLHLAMYNGALHGYSTFLFPCEARFEDELNKLVKAMDDKESRNEFVIFVVTAELGTWDQCQQFFSDYSKRHPGLFKEYEKDMTVGEARGHILLFWTSDKGWTKDIKPFGSLLIEGDDFSSGESGTSKDGGIYRLTDEGYCDWVNPINSLWVNKGAAITVENNGQAQGAAARRVDDVLRHFNEFTKESESGKDTWSVTHLDDVMWWPMPGIAKSMLGPFSEILSHYPDAAWSTRMINDVLIDRLHDIYYKGRKSSTGGIVYFNFAAVRNTYGPQRVIIPVDVYGRSAVAYTLSMNGPCHIN